jgi:hypothetical protein
MLTQTSVQAQVIADTFRAAFAAQKIGEFSVEMTSPEGSTRGGALAMQHILLKAPTGLSLVVGRVNAPERKATLRTFYAVQQLHQQRFQKPVSFEAAAYDGMLETAKSLIGAFGVEIILTDSTGRDPGLDLTTGYVPTSAVAARRPLGVWIAAVGLLTLGVAGVIWALVR